MRATMESRIYKPGELVPFSGIYRIEHASHRMMHHATLTEGMRFPLCKSCRHEVRFTPVRQVRGIVLPFRETEVLEDYIDRPIAVAR
ncbi:MAG TPA: hypothetical protein VFI72_17160 [Candidatus Angelobacter sp.]|nr:hypothetical protein [Candidatus Angelobacter sp.]